MSEPPRFVIARNPDSASSLPYLLRLPIDGGLVLRANVFVEARGRPAIFWQTQKVARMANPGGRVPIVFADSRKHAEEWTYRFLAAALTDAAEPASGASD